MIDLTAKRAEVQKLSVDATALYNEMEADQTKRTADNREKFDKMISKGKDLRKEIDDAETLNAMSRDFAQPAGETKAAGHVPAPAGGDGAQAQRFEGKTWGQVVLESKQFKDAAARWSEGRMDRVKVGDAKAVTSASVTGGAFFQRDRQPEVIDIARQRPFSIMDIINVKQTTVDAVEYVELSSRTNNAAFVDELDPGRGHITTGTAEAIAADQGNFGENFTMKPKGDLAFALKTALVKTVPEWIPVSRQILSDAPNLRGTIDNELTYMLRVKLEDYIISANVTGFVGILNASGIQTRVHKVSGARFTATDTVADTLRRMFTDIALAFYEADAVVLNPAQAEALELEKGSDGHYIMAYDPVAQRVWRKRVVESNAMTAGTAVAGNFALGATLWDRQDVEVRVGEPGNFFLQNAVAILAELRAAFAVVRPLAFEKATGF